MTVVQKNLEEDVMVLKDGSMTNVDADVQHPCQLVVAEQIENGVLRPVHVYVKPL